MEEQRAVEALQAGLGDKTVQKKGISKSGLMTKCGSMYPSWYERFFVLEDGFLTYHTSESKKDFKGTYFLPHCVLSTDTPEPTRIKIVIKGVQGRSFHMKCADEQEAETWKEAIRSWMADE
jgi:hypothetical protein